MADKIQTLLVSLEARITQFEREMKRAIGVSNTSAKKIEDRFKKSNASVAASFDGLGGIIGKAFAGAAALRGAQQLIDASTRIENSLKVAGLSGQALTDVYDKLFASAQKNAAPLEALVDLYGKASQVQKDLGVSTEELLGFTENVSLALRVSGKSAQESSGALLQLSQLLGSGTVRAEEFNSVQEGALPILQAVAAGLKEAGGSVSTLRQLVIDGKVSSEAFFRAFEAGSVVLQEKVAGSVLTISQRLENLKTALIDSAGNFDKATGASQRTGEALQQLAIKIQQIGDFFANNADTIGPVIDGLTRFADAVNNIPGVNPFKNLERDAGKVAEAFGAVVSSVQAYGSTSEATINSINLAIADSMVALDDWSAGWAEALPPELFAKADQIIADLETSKITAADAAKAIEDLGQANPSFAGAFESLGRLAAAFAAVRGEAAATASAVASGVVAPTEGETRNEQRIGRQSVKPVSIADYKAPDSKKTGGVGGGGKSPAQKFSDDLDKQREQNRLLAEETALRATLNPLVNDYGFAVEKLKVSQELQTAATAAGIKMTPELLQTIDQLAAGYADASVEAARLAEEQDNISQLASDFNDAGRSAFSGFISDLRNGVSVADAFGNAMNSILDSVIQIGINSLFGGGGLGSLFGGLFGGLPGHASGTANTGGVRGQVAGIVHGQEAVIPLPNGGKVPVMLKGPGPVTPQGGSRDMHITVGVAADSAGNLTPFVESVADSRVAKAAPSIGRASVSASIKQAPMATAEYQQRRA